MTTPELKAVAEHARKMGWITPPPPTQAPASKPSRKLYPRHNARKRNANLGVVEASGHRWVIEYRPDVGIVVRRFKHHVRHELSLVELVDLAQGQQLISRHVNKGKRPKHFAAAAQTATAQ